MPQLLRAAVAMTGKLIGGQKGALEWATVPKPAGFYDSSQVRGSPPPPRLLLLLLLRHRRRTRLRGSGLNLPAAAPPVPSPPPGALHPTRPLH